MSQLIVDLQPIKEIKPHPNADRLEIAVIKGWNVIVKKGEFHEGQGVVFIPPDAILPEVLHSYLGITNYCAELPKHYLKDEIRRGIEDKDLVRTIYNGDMSQERPTARRVKATRLRGEPSYGTVMKQGDVVTYLHKHYQRGLPIMMQVGSNIAHNLGISKWEPPIKADSTNEGIVKNHPLFVKYTDIENWRNFPDEFVEGENVVISEKIHGQNNRLGLLETTNESGEKVTEFVAGSHNTQRKDGHFHRPYEWYPQIKDLLTELGPGTIIYGEIFGQGIQDMTYDSPHDFLAFDITMGDEYLNFEDFENITRKYDIPIAPVLYRGPYSKSIVEALTDGKTSMCDTSHWPKSRFSGREGIVIRPEPERYSRNIGRLILKSISVDYLARKNPTDGH